MGHLTPELAEQWLRQQEADEKQRQNTTIVKLPCCGSGIEVTAAQLGEDQWIVCPNQHCGKRHLLTWGMKPTIQSELII
jgi:hypothetical protein